MSLSVTGDFDAFRGMTQRLDLLGKPKWRKGLAKNLAEEAQTQIALGFRGARDPYGRPWPVSRRASMSGGLTLSKTGRLKNSWSGARARWNVDENGFTLGTNVVYAKSHQLGLKIKAKTARGLRFKLYRGPYVVVRSVKLPKRMMVPENGNLGPIWSQAFNEAASAYVRASVRP